MCFVTRGRCYNVFSFVKLLVSYKSPKTYSFRVTMKATDVSAEDVAVTEITPSKKKLKQARLPFQIISPASPVNTSPVSRKRKLSAQQDGKQNKIGKIFKENETKNKETVPADVVVISDDDNSRDTCRLSNGSNISNDKLEKEVMLDNVSSSNEVISPSTETKNRKRSLRSNRDDAVTGVNDTKTPTPKHSQKKAPQKAKQKLSKSTKITKKSADQNEHNTTTDDSGKPAEEETNKPPVEKSKEETSKELKTTESEQMLVDLNKEVEDNKREDTEMMDLDKSDENLDKSQDQSTSFIDMNASLKSNSSSPRPKRNSLTATTPTSNKTSSPALTPKQALRKLEYAKKREEKEREKLDKEQKRQQEKELREKQKQEKEDQKRREREEKEELRRKEREEKEELKRKEKEEKEEQRKKEKEEKERQKEKERRDREEKEEQRRKEKEEKEEQKRKEKEAKEEERRKKQEALDEEKRQKELERQEAEIKKKKAAAAFANFFVAGKQKGGTDIDNKSDQVENKNSILSSFAVKLDMRLAPIVRNLLEEDKKKNLESQLVSQNAIKHCLYVQELKSGALKPKSSRNTWPLDELKDEVTIIESEDDLPDDCGNGQVVVCDTVREKLRPKLLSFRENRRPPYWGTWRKKSNVIKGRRPFRTDEKYLDYTCDSDEEWEEEEGESVGGSGSEDENEADEYELDNEFFVPHGYLSEEEALGEDEAEAALSPEHQKAKLKYLGDEFESELKKPTERLKPRLYGVMWETSDGGKPDSCIDAVWKYFNKMSMIITEDSPVLTPPVVEPRKANTKPDKATKTEKKNSKPEKANQKQTENKLLDNNKTGVPVVKKRVPLISLYLKKKDEL